MAASPYSSTALSTEESRFKSLKFLNHHISIIVTGKRVNKGIGLKLEIPVDYFFHRYNRVIEWFKES